MPTSDEFPNDLIPISEGARSIGVSIYTMRRMIERGEVRAWRIGRPTPGRRLTIRVSASDVLSCMQPVAAPVERGAR